ncbi:hypothetical protein Tco_0658841, partial [Tanacetum coccineum]
FTKSKVVPVKQPESVSTSAIVITERLSNTSQKPLTRYQRKNKQEKAISADTYTATVTQSIDDSMKLTVCANQQDPNRNWGSNVPNSPYSVLKGSRRTKAQRAYRALRRGAHFNTDLSNDDCEEIEDELLNDSNLGMDSTNTTHLNETCDNMNHKEFVIFDEEIVMEGIYYVCKKGIGDCLTTVRAV